MYQTAFDEGEMCHDRPVVIKTMIILEWCVHNTCKNTVQNTSRSFIVVSGCMRFYLDGTCVVGVLSQNAEI